MAIAFPRSLRALDNDRFRPSLITLGITLSILGAILVWFFLGSVPILETFTDVKFQSDGLLYLSVPADQLARIIPSSKATIQILAAGRVTKTYSGYVTRAEPANGQANGRVVVYLGTNERLPDTTKAQISIQTETLSPLAYAVRAVQRSDLAQVIPLAPPTPPTP